MPRARKPECSSRGRTATSAGPVAPSDREVSAVTDHATCVRCGGALAPVLVGDPAPPDPGSTIPLGADPPVTVRCVGCEPETFAG